MNDFLRPGSHLMFIIHAMGGSFKKFLALPNKESLKQDSFSQFFNTIFLYLIAPSVLMLKHCNSIMSEGDNLVLRKLLQSAYDFIIVSKGSVEYVE